MFNQILYGNHLDILPRFPDDTFDMFLTSPPYDNLRSYEGYDFQFEPLARELYRLLKPGGVGVWVVNDATIDGSETLTSAKQKIFFRDIGFNIWDTMIYAHSSFYPQKSRYKQTFEYCFVLAKASPLTFHPLKDCFSDYIGKTNTVKKRRKDGRFDVAHVQYQEGSQRGNVWFYATGFNLTSKDSEAFEHPAIFPEKLAEDHILSWSNPGDVVLDPMCGSGTTCKMAAKHGRKYVGIDIAEKYCEIARKRVALIEAQPLLFNEANVSLHCQFD